MEPFSGSVRVRGMERKTDEGPGMELEALLRDRLRQLPVPPPSPGFAARVFAGLEVRQPRRMTPPFAMALAASLALGVGLTVWRQDRAPAAPGVKVVAFAPEEVHSVRLLFRSPRALNGVTIHLQLPAGVELAGHPGRHELRWQTDLQAGANQLDLPVIVQSGEGGLITADLNYGQDRRQFAVLVQARRPAVLGPAPTAVHAAAALAPDVVSTHMEI